jgi:hypothetical protein
MAAIQLGTNYGRWNAILNNEIISFSRDNKGRVTTISCIISKEIKPAVNDVLQTNDSYWLINGKFEILEIIEKKESGFINSDFFYYKFSVQ